MDGLVLIGAGGHCRVVLDLLRGIYDIVGITDIDEARHGMHFHGARIVGGDDVLRREARPRRPLEKRLDRQPRRARSFAANSFARRRRQAAQ